MLNRCYTYVLPAITDTIKIHKSLVSNVYLRSLSMFDPSYIFIAFKYDKEYLDYLKTVPQLEEFKIKDNLIITKIKLDDYQSNINMLYIQGKYSSFPIEYKSKILAFHNLNKNSKVYQVLYKLPILKQKIEEELKIKLKDDVELGIKTNILEETYE